jgi:hypothetical protein
MGTARADVLQEEGRERTSDEPEGGRREGRRREEKAKEKERELTSLASWRREMEPLLASSSLSLLLSMHSYSDPVEEEAGQEQLHSQAAGFQSRHAHPHRQQTDIGEHGRSPESSNCSLVLAMSAACRL